jgi:hypothetical protein
VRRHSKVAKTNLCVHIFPSAAAEAVLMMGDHAQGHLDSPLQGVDHGPEAEATHLHPRESIVQGIVFLSSSYADHFMALIQVLIVDMTAIYQVSLSSGEIYFSIRVSFPSGQQIKECKPRC